MKLIEYVCRKYEYSEFEANGYIMAGKVLVNNEMCTWPKRVITESDIIRIKHKKSKFVTRSGYKLEEAIKAFRVEVKEKITLDIGASEGGFTDCLLKYGARKVYAVDVAYGIFDYQLRINPKVVVLERKNAKYLSEKDIPEAVDILTIDVSFISLSKIIPVSVKFLKKNGMAIFLFKPQFELAADELGRNGIPYEKTTIISRIEKLVMEMQTVGLIICDIKKSPIMGNSGNIEYLLLGKFSDARPIERCQIQMCVLEG